MARVLGVGLENAVGGRVVTSSVHGIGTGLIQGSREAHIARLPPGDGDIETHDGQLTENGNDKQLENNTDRDSWRKDDRQQEEWRRKEGRIEGIIALHSNGQRNLRPL